MDRDGDESELCHAYPFIAFFQYLFICLFVYLFIWLCQVLVVARQLLSCGRQPP